MRSLMQLWERFTKWLEENNVRAESPYELDSLEGWQ